MAINKRFTQILQEEGSVVRQRARLRHQRRALARFAQHARNPDVVFLPHRLNLK